MLATYAETGETSMWKLLSLISVFIICTAAPCGSAPFEVYQLEGNLIAAADGQVAAKTTSQNQYSQVTRSTVGVVDLKSGNETYRITSQQILDSHPHLANDADAASAIHYNFGTSAAISGNRLVVGSPGSEWYCDCAIDPGIEVRGRPGHAFVISRDNSAPPVTISAPALDILLTENKYDAAWDWINFGEHVAALESIAIVRGRVFDIATGAELARLARDPDPLIGSGDFYGSVAMDGATAVAARPWSLADKKGVLHVYDLVTGRRTHMLMPSNRKDFDYFGNSIALEGNLALAGAPGSPIWAREPGKAYLFDVKTGKRTHRVQRGRCRTTGSQRRGCVWYVSGARRKYCADWSTI